MNLYRTQSILIADLGDVTPRILPAIQSEWFVLTPFRPLTAADIEEAFDWIVQESLVEVLRHRGQFVEMANHLTHDLYKTIYRIPAIKTLVDRHMGYWINTQGLHFANGTILKAIVTYSQLILVRSL